MIKITVEELEIKIEANVTKVMPQIKQITQNIKSEIKKTGNEINQISQKIETEVFKGFSDMTSASDVSGMKINGKNFNIKNIAGAKTGGNYTSDTNQLKEYRNTVEEINTAHKKTGNIIQNTNAIKKQSVDILEILKNQTNKCTAGMSNSNKQQELLIYKAKELEATLQGIKSSPSFASNYSSKEILEMEASLDKIKRKIKDVKKESKSTGISVGDTFKGMLKSAGKYALALLSIRTAYALVSKASSAYLSVDEEKANKLQSVWVGLGAMLEPVLEVIINSLVQGVVHLNALLKAIFGVDLLANAMEKTKNSANGANKAVNSLKNTVAGFDEISNINEDNSAIGGLDFKWYDAFKDIDLDTDITRKITKVAETIKKVWNAVMNPSLGGFTGSIMGQMSAWFGAIFPTDEKGWEDLAKNKSVYIVTSILNGLLLGIPGAIARKSKTGEGFWQAWYNSLIDQYNASKFEEKFKGLGEKIIRGLIAGLTFGISELVIHICNMCDFDIVGTIKEKLGIHSPSTVMEEIGRNIIQGLINGVTGFFGNVGNTISTISNDIKNIFTEKLSIDKFRNIGQNISNGIRDGIQNMSGNLRNTVNNLGGNVTNWLKSKLGIHSPSIVMRNSIGRFIPLGIAEGIDEEAKSVYSSMADITDNMQSSIPKLDINSDIKGSINSN